MRDRSGRSAAIGGRAWNLKKTVAVRTTLCQGFLVRHPFLDDVATKMIVGVAWAQQRLETRDVHRLHGFEVPEDAFEVTTKLDDLFLRNGDSRQVCPPTDVVVRDPHR